MWRRDQDKSERAWERRGPTGSEMRCSRASHRKESVDGARVTLEAQAPLVRHARDDGAGRKGDTDAAQVSEPDGLK